MKTPPRAGLVGAADQASLGNSDPHFGPDPFRAIGRQLREIGKWLTTPEGDFRYRNDPEVREVVNSLYENAKRMAEIIQFVMTGDRVAPRYNLTSDQFWAIVWSQSFGCAICRREFEPGGLRMLVDHNHASGDVRGILCGNCNTGLGHFKDSPDLLDAAIAYLDLHGCYGPDALAEGGE